MKEAWFFDSENDVMLRVLVNPIDCTELIKMKMLKYQNYFQRKLLAQTGEVPTPQICNVAKPSSTSCVPENKMRFIQMIQPLQGGH